MAANLVSQDRITKMRSAPDVLWGGGSPLPDSVWAWVVDFMDDIERFMSLSDAMHKHSVDSVTWQMLMSRSPWVCERLNAFLSVKAMDGEFALLERAFGRVAEDSNGNPAIDSKGRLVREEGSDNLLKFVVERNERSAHAPYAQETSSVFPPGPLSPSNIDAHRQLQIDDCRLALDALRPAVRAGDRQAIDSFTKVQDRLAKLSGTDAPKQTISYTRGDGAARLRDDELEAIAAGKVVYLKQGEDGTYEAPDESEGQ